MRLPHLVLQLHNTSWECHVPTSIIFLCSWKRDYHFGRVCIVNMFGYALWNIYIKVSEVFI